VAEEPVDGRRRWFALRVKSRCEKIVSTILQHKGFEEFLPIYESRRRWSDRLQPVKMPLFLGYVFCRLDPQYRLSLLTTPGVLYFVGIGKIPTPIDDAEIAAIQSVVRSGLRVDPWPVLDVGRRVLLQEGPLAGLEGLLVEARKQHRIVVSVTLLRRSVAVEIEREWVMPLGGANAKCPFEGRPERSSQPHLSQKFFNLPMAVAVLKRKPK
jgi:transcription antitermination factor NusG